MNELKNNTVVDILQERMKREKAQSEDSMSFQSQMSGVSREQEILLLENLAKNAQGIVRNIEDRVQKIQADNLGFTRITFLPNKELKAPIEVVVERDGDALLARTLELPLYGQGNDAIDAIAALKYEIESLYDDLMEDDNFSDEWLKIKEYLKARISDR